jgi:F-type H+-transporting ATPase subunit b
MLRSCITALVLLLLIAPAALAAEDEGPKGIFYGGIELAIWTVVVFLILLFILGYFFWPMMLHGLEKREQAIAQAMEEARKARLEAEHVRTDLEKRMNRAGEEIRQMMDQARQNAQQAADELLARTRAELQTDRERLHREVQMAKDQALSDIFTQAGQLATVISAKTIRRHLSDEDHRRLVDEALAELKNRVPAAGGNGGTVRRS